MTEIHYSWNNPEWPLFNIVCKHGDHSDSTHIAYAQDGNIKRALEEMNSCVGREAFHYTPKFPEFRVLTKNPEMIYLLFRLAEAAGMKHQHDYGPIENAIGFCTNKYQNYNWINYLGIGNGFVELTFDEAITLLTCGETKVIKDYTINVTLRTRAKSAEEATELVRKSLSGFDFELEIK